MALKRGHEADDTLAETVPGVVLRSALLYYQNEPVVQQCRQLLAGAIFPPAWRIAFSEDPASPAGPALFNTPMIKRQLQRFLMDALDWLRVHGCVPFWYRKDLARWLQQFHAARSPAEVEQAGLPFGVLDPADVQRLERHTPRAAGAVYERALVVSTEQGEEDAVSRRNGYGVFEDTLSLVPLNTDELRRAMEYVAQHTTDPEGGETSAWTRDMRKPASSVYALMHRARQVQEADRNVMDADWAVSHPRWLFRTVIPNVAAVAPESLGDRALYNSNDLYSAASNKLREEEHWTLSGATHFLQSLNRQFQSGMASMRPQRRGGSGVTMRQHQQAHYDRPDAIEDAFPLPPNMEVAHAPLPSVINDARGLEQLYRSEVIAFMGVPEAVLSRGGGSAGRNTSGTLTGEKQSEMHALYYMEQIVARCRVQLQKLFGYVLLTSMGAYQLQQLDYVEEELEAAADVEDGPGTTLTVWKERVRASKHRIGVLHEADAVLVFPQQGTLEQTENFATQLGLFKLGLVEVPDLQHAARGAISQDINLREPPPEPGEPPAKKKRKKSKGKSKSDKGGDEMYFLERTPRAEILQRDKS